MHFPHKIIKIEDILLISAAAVLKETPLEIS